MPGRWRSSGCHGASTVVRRVEAVGRGCRRARVCGVMCGRIHGVRGGPRHGGGGGGGGGRRRGGDGR